jgi:hypothetical protein
MDKRQKLGKTGFFAARFQGIEGLQLSLQRIAPVS